MKFSIIVVIILLAFAFVGCNHGNPEPDPVVLKCGDTDSPHADCSICSERPGDTSLLRACAVCAKPDKHKRAHTCAHGHSWG